MVSGYVKDLKKPQTCKIAAYAAMGTCPGQYGIRKITSGPFPDLILENKY